MSEHARSIRVFISSTFRDMQEEREEIIKRISPQLRRQCEERGVAWSEVDLRWGITTDQADNGEVIPICLTEVDNCKPFFIGILGERYGWIPDEIPAELVQEQPWLKNTNGRSVTELEILHGALNNPQNSPYAFFYFRDPAHDPNGPDIENAVKQQDLKNRIRRSGFPVYENYKSAAELGEQILADWAKVIDQVFPQKEIPDLAQLEEEGHKLFASRRTQFFHKQANTFASLDQYVNEPQKFPLIIVGESGTGKSTLVANWIPYYNERQQPSIPVPEPEQKPFWKRIAGKFLSSSEPQQQEEPPVTSAKVIVHYVGATPNSSNLRSIIGRLMGELGVVDELPDNVDALCSFTISQLYEQQEPIIIVIDGLDKIEDRDGAPDLLWLPTVLPENIHIIMTTSSGRSLEEAQRRQWKIHHLETLTSQDIETFTNDYLAYYRKALASTQVKRIAETTNCANSLFLKTILEEMRVFGIHEEIDERLDGYLGTSNLQDLYDKVIERYEQDFSLSMVQHMMSLLWASRYGLSEAELRELLGENEETLSSAQWSPLFVTVERLLVSQFGLLSFSNASLGNAVEKRYLPTLKDKQEIHVELADYFAKSTRQIAEFPWQLLQSHQWARLVDYLKSGEIVDQIVRRDFSDYQTYWAQIHQNSDFRMLDTYQDVVDNPTQSPTLAWVITEVLINLGETDSVEEFVKKLILVSDMPISGITFKLMQSHPAAWCARLGEIKMQQNNLKEARFWLQEAEKRADQDNLPSGQLAKASSIAFQGEIFEREGHPQEALKYYERSESIYRKLNIKIGVADVLNRQAIILESQKNLDSAELAYRKAEKFLRSANDFQRLARNLGDQAVFYAVKKDYSKSLQLYKEAEQLFRTLGNQFDLCISLINQANLEFERNNKGRAQEILDEIDTLIEHVDNDQNLFRYWFFKANMAAELTEKRQYAEKAKAFAGIYVPPVHQFALQDFLLSIYMELKDYDAAMGICEEQNTLATSVNHEIRMILSNSTKLYIAETMYIEGLLTMDLEEQQQFSNSDPENMQPIMKLKNNQEFIERNTLLIMQYSPMGKVEKLAYQCTKALEGKKVDEAEKLFQERENLLDKLNHLMWLKPHIPAKREISKSLQSKIDQAKGTRRTPTPAVAETDQNAQLQNLELQFTLALSTQDWNRLVQICLEKGILERNLGDTNAANQTLDTGLKILKDSEKYFRSVNQWAVVSQNLHVQFQFVWNKPPTADSLKEVDRLIIERLEVAKKSGDPRQITEAMLGRSTRMMDMQDRKRMLADTLEMAKQHGFQDIIQQVQMQIQLFSFLK